MVVKRPYPYSEGYNNTKTLVAIRVKGETELYEFKTRQNALDFIEALESAYGKIDYLISSIDKSPVEVP